MKRLTLIVFILILLVGCNKKEVKVYMDSEVSEFNEILKNVGNGKTKAYDLRSYVDCYEARIPGFYCATIVNQKNEEKTINQIANDLTLILGKKKNTMIILIDYDGRRSEELTTILNEFGYYNIHYFKSGYARYVELNDDFVPESGDCDC